MTQWPMDPDETLLWQGAPRGDLVFGAEALAGAIPGGLLIAVATGVVVAFGDRLGDLAVPLIGGAVVVGAILTILFPLLDQQARRNTTYALTTKRAFIRQTGLRNRVEQDDTGWVLHDPDKIRLVTGPPDTIYFARRPTSGRKGGVAPPVGFDIGFRRIENGAALYQQMIGVATTNQTAR